jgi:antitoxin CcdA
MSIGTHHEESKRRPVNLTIREDVMREAKLLRLNASQAAEQGIAEAVKKAKEQVWLEENRGAIRAYNERIEKHGTLLTPLWLEENA